MKDLLFFLVIASVAIIILSTSAVFIVPKIVTRMERNDKKENETEKEQERLRQAVRSLWSDLTGQATDGINSVMSNIRSAIDLEQLVSKLKTELSDLKIQKSQKDEEFGRKEREIEHKLGLERRRQEQDLDIERRKMQVEYDAKVLEIKKEALVEDRKRFEGQMEFHKKELKEQLKGQNELIQRLVGDISRSFKTKTGE